MTIDSEYSAKSAGTLTPRSKFESKQSAIDVKTDHGASADKLKIDEGVMNSLAKVSIDELSMSVAVDPEGKEAIIQLRSKKTGEVVATIPAEHSRNIKRQVEVALGKIFDGRV
jgi:uncharacterized FlaG/YvyC family protein